MPLYDHECQECGFIFEGMKPFELRTMSCPKCDAVAKRIVSPMRSAQIDIFEGGHYEELGDDVPYIRSRNHLAEECEKRGLVSRALGEGFNSHQRRRWF